MSHLEPPRPYYAVEPEQLDQLLNLISMLDPRERAPLMHWLCSIQFRAASLLAERIREQARELSGRTGKRLHVDVFGFQYGIDARQFELFSLVLLHGLNNSAAHGISKQGRIRASLALEVTEWRLSLSDDGVGVQDPAVLASVFQPGFTTRTGADEISGRGMGLSAVAEMVRAAGGKVSATSSPGAGFTLDVSVPVQGFSAEVRMIQVGGRRYWVPVSDVLQLPDEAGRPVISLGGFPAKAVDSVGEPVLLPFHRISETLSWSGPDWIRDLLEAHPGPWFAGLGVEFGLWLDRSTLGRV